MKTMFLPILIGVAVVILISPCELRGQGAVLNGDFETQDYTPLWTLTGGNTFIQVVHEESTAGNDSWCIKRTPGTPSNNGGIQQSVHLIGGVTYVFDADIVSKWCTS